MTSTFWDNRYSSDTLVYGESPNDFLIAALKDRPLPKNANALDLGAGEGRNALYLASLGYNTLAVDQSPIGMQKAARLAQQVRPLPGVAWIYNETTGTIHANCPEDAQLPELHVTAVARWWTPYRNSRVTSP